MLTAPGRVVVRVPATIAPAFLFTLVCSGARKKISSCKALHFQKLRCLTSLSAESDVGLLLPSSMHKPILDARAERRLQGCDTTGQAAPAARSDAGASPHPCIPVRRRVRVMGATRWYHAQIGMWRSRVVTWVDTATVAGEMRICSQLALCGAVYLTPMEISIPVPPRTL